MSRRGGAYGRPTSVPVENIWRRLQDLGRGARAAGEDRAIVWPRGRRDVAAIAARTRLQGAAGRRRRRRACRIRRSRPSMPAQMAR